MIEKRRFDEWYQMLCDAHDLYEDGGFEYSFDEFVGVLRRGIGVEAPPVDSFNRSVKLLSRKEAATKLGISVRTLSRLMADGVIPVVHIGRRALLHPSAIDAFVDGRLVPAKVA